MNLAFVLLSEAKLPEGEDVERAFASCAGKGQVLSLRASKPGNPKKADTLELDTGGGGYAVVALMPAPVPNKEADEAARYSVSALGGRWKLPPHKAHLVVTAQGTGTPLASLDAFTSIVAASRPRTPWASTAAARAPRTIRSSSSSSRARRTRRPASCSGAASASHARRTGGSAS